jgi:hypothetical protein
LWIAFSVVSWLLIEGNGCRKAEEGDGNEGFHGNIEFRRLVEKVLKRILMKMMVASV